MAKLSSTKTGLHSTVLMTVGEPIDHAMYMRMRQDARHKGDRTGQLPGWQGTI